MLGQGDLLEYPVGFPPPVVLRLSEFGLPVVAVEVGKVCVGALDAIGPEMNNSGVMTMVRQRLIKSSHLVLN